MPKILTILSAFLVTTTVVMGTDGPVFNKSNSDPAILYKNLVSQFPTLSQEEFWELHLTYGSDQEQMIADLKLTRGSMKPDFFSTSVLSPGMTGLPQMSAFPFAASGMPVPSLIVLEGKDRGDIVASLYNHIHEEILYVFSPSSDGKVISLEELFSKPGFKPCNQFYKARFEEFLNDRQILQEKLKTVYEKALSELGVMRMTLSMLNLKIKDAGYGLQKGQMESGIEEAKKYVLRAQELFNKHSIFVQSMKKQMDHLHEDSLKIKQHLVELKEKIVKENS